MYYPKEMFPTEYPAGFGELYNIVEDPWEMKNLFFDPACGNVVGEMMNDLTEWLITTTRPTTVIPAAIAATPQASVRYENAVNADGKIHPDRIRERLFKNYI